MARQGAWAIHRLDDEVRVPPGAADLKIRFMIVAHAGTAEHRGEASTKIALRGEFTWDQIPQHVLALVATCVLCILVWTAKKIPGPLTSTTDGTEPKEEVYFDYLHMGKSYCTDKYILAVKEDISSYLELEKTDATNAENDAITMAKWFRVFTAPQIWISDQGPHFINLIM